MTHLPIPADFPVQPLKSGEHCKGETQCGCCGLRWNDDKPTSWTPVPAGRCPFEYFHTYDEDEVDDGGGTGAGCCGCGCDESLNDVVQRLVVACGALMKYSANYLNDAPAEYHTVLDDISDVLFELESYGF